MSFSPVSTKKVTRKPITALIIIAVLSLFVAVSALPRYFSAWPWSTPLKVANQPKLQAIREQGIELPGWVTDDHISTKLGGDTWSMQQLSAENDGQFAEAVPATVALLLRPQVWEKDQPEVEWLDLKGAQGWQTDTHQNLSFDVYLPVAANTSDSEDLPQNRQTIRINTDFFRAWNKDQTYAILQWYASPLGGSPSPAWWFWSDQKVQWSARQRLPWVAVSVWLPIDPLSDIVPHKELAVALGQSVQTELLQTIFPETIEKSKKELSTANLSNLDRSDLDIKKSEMTQPKVPKKISTVEELPIRALFREDAASKQKFHSKRLSPNAHASFVRA